MTVHDNAPAMQAAVSVQPVVRPHRSPSSMSTYFRCGEYWRRVYLENQRPAPAIAMLKGTGMHAAAEVNFRQKIESHQDLQLSEIVDAAVAGFDAALTKDGCSLSQDETAIGKEIVIAQARDEVRTLAAGFAVHQAKEYQPIDVELTVRIPVPRSSHDLLGRIDLVAEIAGQSGHRVRDFKTAKKRKSAIDSASSDQLTFYAAGHHVHYGFPPVDVGLDVLVHTTKGVSRQDLPDTRDKADFAVLANKFNAMDQGIKAGIFLPADNGHWFCRASMCPFHADGSCVYVNSERQAAAKATEE